MVLGFGLFANKYAVTLLSLSASVLLMCAHEHLVLVGPRDLTPPYSNPPQGNPRPPSLPELQLGEH
jgi:hypothetical protein